MAKLRFSTSKAGRISACSRNRSGHPTKDWKSGPACPLLCFRASLVVEYRARRHLLEEALRGDDGAILLSKEVRAEPAELRAHACSMRLEGNVVQRQDSPYRSGRAGDWIKHKCALSEAFMVVSYELSTGPRSGFSSLLLGAYRGDLIYVGGIGTGFKEHDTIKKMDKQLCKRKHPPVPYSGKRNVVWLQPTLIAEVEFRAWTTDEKLRHPLQRSARPRRQC